MFFKIFLSLLLFFPLVAQKPAVQNKKNSGKGGLLDLFDEPKAKHQKKIARPVPRLYVEDVVDHKAKAKQLLDLVREDEIPDLLMFSFFLEHFEKGNFLLADIGTSKKEILQLQIKGNAEKAQFWANEGKGKDNSLKKVYLEYSAEYLKKAQALINELNELDGPKNKVILVLVIWEVEKHPYIKVNREDLF